MSQEADEKPDATKFAGSKPYDADVLHATVFSARAGKIRELARGTDKEFVSKFIKDAEQILAAAGLASESEMAILIHGCRGIHLVAGKSDWRLESLMAESGAAAAYRVSSKGGEVLVEGRSQSESCRLRKWTPTAVMRDLLPERRLYEMAGSQCGSEPRMLLT